MENKLLFLGVDTTTKYALAYAKEQGVTTVITDYYPIDSSLERRMADEQWAVDVVDLDTLEENCRRAHVTGVYAGNHELCLDMAKALCKRLGLPFYASDEGWACARDKLRFKRHCIACGLSVPKQYDLTLPFQQDILDRISYPVIVKPADACAQRGLSLCHNEEELRAAYPLALRFSDSGTVLVEEWIQGEEISIDYLFIDGKPHIVGLNRGIFMEVNQRHNFSLFLEPSIHYAAYAKQTEGKVEQLFERMHWTTGIAFLQAICREGEYYFLEMGGRMDGVGSWTKEKDIIGKSRLEYMVDLALGQPIQPVCDPNIYHYKQDSTVYLVWAKAGNINRVAGEAELASMPGVHIVLKRFAQGETIQATDNMLQIAYYLTIVADCRAQLIQKIQTINQTLHLYDEQGRELLLPFTAYDALME